MKQKKHAETLATIVSCDVAFKREKSINAPKQTFYQIWNLSFHSVFEFG